MACNANAPLANAEVASVPQTAQQGPLLSPLILHYNTIAYALVIGTLQYVFAFGEYLYLRLTSLILPEKVVYHSACEKRSSEVVGKDALHYVIIIVAFCSVALFQFICFFGLAISEKWTVCTLPLSDPAAREKHALAAHIRYIMSSTLYPTFICYILSSLIVWGVIFYMIGVRDSVDEIASSISLYVFDVVLLIYFLVFPVVIFVYHPFVRTSAALRIARMHDAAASPTNIPPIQELRADGTMNLMIDGPAPLASPDVSSSPTPRAFPASDSYTPLSATSDNHYCPQHFNRNARLTTTV